MIASVTIDRMMQISSATAADLGEDRADLLARLAVLLERVLRGEAGELLPLELRDRHPGGERPRHRLAVHRGELGLVVERLQVRRPAGHVQVDDPLRLRGEVERVDHPRPAPRRRASRRRASRLGFRSDARPSEPTRPCPPGDPSGCAAGETGIAVDRTVQAEERMTQANSRRSLIGGRLRHLRSIRSVPRDRLVQVQDRPRHRRPGRQLGRVERPAARGCSPTWSKSSAAVGGSAR